MADLSECFAIAIRELHATTDLLTEHAIFCYQVRIAKPEFCVNSNSRKSLKPRPDREFWIGLS